MRQISKIFALATMMFAFTATTFGQATATASATIVSPIAISRVDNMNFGNIAADPLSSGTVELTAAAVPVRTPTTVTLPATTGTVTAASFTVTGVAGYTYAITLPTTSVSLGTATLYADTFVSDKPLNIGTIDGSPLYVGATLHVGAAEVAGSYTSAAFTVTVNYN